MVAAFVAARQVKKTRDDDRDCARREQEAARLDRLWSRFCWVHDNRADLGAQAKYDMIKAIRDEANTCEDQALALMVAAVRRGAIDELRSRLP